MGVRKTFCPKGHNTLTVGRNKSGACRECHRGHINAWYAKNLPYKHERDRKYRLKSDFGISISEWEQMFKAQQGCCAICKRSHIEIGRTFHVDHNHKMNKVRALLCSKCNAGLGYFCENISYLKQAIEYLIVHNNLNCNAI